MKPLTPEQNKKISDAFIRFEHSGDLLKGSHEYFMQWLNANTAEPISKYKIALRVWNEWRTQTPPYTDEGTFAHWLVDKAMEKQ